MGGSQEAILKQTGSLVKSFQAEEREKIIKEIGTKVSIPPDHLASMKANLNLPWYQLRQISRWLKTFDIRFSSEQSARKISKEWVGIGLQVETAPPVQGSGKEVEIVERP